MKRFQVDAENLPQLYRGLLIGAVVNAVLAWLVAMLLEPMVSSAVRLAWLGLMGVVLSLRLLLAAAWARVQRKPGGKTDGVWLMRYRILAFATGAVWGIGSIAMFPAGEVTYQIFFALVLAGISAGAITTMAPDAVSAFGLILPTTLPGIVRLLLEGGQLPVMMGAMGMVFVLYLIASVLRAEARFTEIMHLRADAAKREAALLEGTERLRAAIEEAERANRAKSEFLASMSHELRTPLNSVLGYSQLMGTDDRLPAEVRENADEIHRAGGRLLTLVDGLIDLARIESGSVTLSLQSMPVYVVAREAVDKVGPLTAKGKVELLNRIGRDEPIRVIADYQRLRQVLTNLLSNAIKFNRPGGNVTLDCQRHEGMVRISVSDTGYGIAPNKRVRVFAPFDRLGEEMGAIEGTGIGLAISKRMIDAMQGRIWFESTEGVGTTFWIELPGPESGGARGDG